MVLAVYVYMEHLEQVKLHLHEGYLKPSIRPLLIKRGSDLISAWVGETEQNLAKAFHEAEDLQAILLLDEVDGLLQDRRQATRSWEVSQVNEFLVQLEALMASWWRQPIALMSLIKLRYAVSILKCILIF